MLGPSFYSPLLRSVTCPQVRVVSIRIILLSLLAAGAITARRVAVKRANRSVEIVVEWDEIRELALATRGDSEPPPRRCSATCGRPTRSAAWP